MNAILPASFRKFAEAKSYDLGQELIIDSFAGGGGASEGIEEAFRRMKLLGIVPEDHRGLVDIAINHDDKAIAMHLANHPGTMHLTADMWAVDPRTCTGGLPVGAFWASPDCRHHSKAKGGRPVSESVRDLAWVVGNWADLVKPRMIFLENVEEFRDWGPLVSDENGEKRPNPLKKGATFKRWVRHFKRLGYRVEWRELRASEYGVPTIRKRLYIIMRCDEQPIEWPDTTSGDPKSEEVKSGELWPYDVAANHIDFDRPCPSIFLTKVDAKAYRATTGTAIIRPLAENTLRRIAKGIERYVIDVADDDRFIVTCNHNGDGFRGQSVHEPFNTVAAARDAHGLVVPHVVGVGGRMGQSSPRSANAPWHTITTKPDSAIVAPHLVSVNHGDSGGRREYGVDSPFGTVETQPSRALISPHLMAYYGHSPAGGNDRSARIDEPVRVITTEPRHALIAPYLVPRYGERPGQAPRTLPLNGLMPTIVPTGNGGDLAAAMLAPFVTYGQHGGLSRPATSPHHTVEASIKDTNALASVFLKRDFGASVGSDVDAPSGTIMPGGGGKTSVVAAFLSQHTENAIGKALESPGPTITTRGTQTHLAAVYMAQNNTDVIGHAAEEPASTIVGRGSTQSVVMAMITHMYSSNTAGGDGSVKKPLKTILTGNHANLVTMPLMTAYYGSDEMGGAENAPARTVTSKPRFGHVEVDAAAPPLSETQLARAREVASFLRQFGCWDDREFVTVGEWVVVDIGMRMLTPRELARMQGFRDSYILAAPYNGKTLTETDQRHKIGNSVCPEMATRIFMANYRPERRQVDPLDQGWLFEAAA